MSHSFIAISLKLDFNDLDLFNFIDHHLVVSSKCINQYIEKCTTFNDVYIFVAEKVSLQVLDNDSGAFSLPLLF